MHGRILSVAVVSLALVSCANRPPPKPNSFRQLGYLGIQEQKASGGIGPLAVSALNRLDVPSTGGPVYNSATLGMAIGSAIRAGKNAAYNQLSTATSSVNLDVLAVFRSAFEGEVARLDVGLQIIDDAGVAAKMRNNNFKPPLPAFDGVVDLQIYNVGYYDLGKNKGFTPTLSIYARVFDLVNAGNVAEDWSCDAPAEPDDPEGRDLLFPPDILMPTLGAFGPSAERIRAEFTRVIEACGKRLAAEIAQFKKKKQDGR
jgi:hypothetical protein